jgi:hypothetical protein
MSVLDTKWGRPELAPAQRLAETKEAEMRGVMYVDDLVRYLRIVYSRRFIDLFESQITSQIILLRSSKAPGVNRKMWSKEARQSLRYAFFLRYYASFERHLKVICERFAEKESLSSRLTHIKRGRFLERVNMYLTHVVKCEALDKHPLWEDVIAYSWIRNAIIHDDGWVPNPAQIPSEVTRQLRLSSAALGLSPKGIITMKRRFCHRAVKNMAQFLLDIYGRKE